ncbi:ABC transporter ATP-binding protein [Gorillibacterium sp. sgz5001074]|uniref:ABC transporter ATP-binding protein n=1 Tax=Gorillibacterium sp. sgz5001074 TaxID=3446695 RepID=UPI003F66683D
MEEMILRVKGLTKRYGAFRLDRVNLEIPKGYIMGFVGQNGSGKSTTIKCMMDLIPFEEGTVELFGQGPEAKRELLKERIGYVSEDSYFYEDMTVEWTGRFVGRFYRNWDSALYRKLLARFQVDPRKKIKELSRGMKVKLSLALAMAHHPELLILDEPTSGLDPVVRNELLEVFLEIIQNESCSIFFSSHISSDIEKVADYITVIHDGRIVVSTDKHSLLDSWRIIRADRRYDETGLVEGLFGVKRNEFGFSGIAKDPQAFAKEWRSRFHDGEYKSERLTVDELLVRLAREEDKVCSH